MDGYTIYIQTTSPSKMYIYCFGRLDSLNHMVTKGFEVTKTEFRNGPRSSKIISHASIGGLF